MGKYKFFFNLDFTFGLGAFQNLRTLQMPCLRHAPRPLHTAFTPRHSPCLRTPRYIFPLPYSRHFSDLPFCRSPTQAAALFFCSTFALHSLFLKKRKRWKNFCSWTVPRARALRRLNAALHNAVPVFLASRAVPPHRCTAAHQRLHL